MTVPVLESRAETSFTSTSSWVANAPAGIASGDLLLAIFALGTHGGAFTGPSGWTEGPREWTAAPYLHCWWKIAGGSEPSTYAFTAAGSRSGRVNIHRISGADATSPINTSTSVNLSSATGNPLTLSSVTPTADDCLYFVDLVCNASGSIRTWTESTPMAAVYTPPANGIQVAGFTENRGAAAATGAYDFTVSSLADRSGMGIMVAPPAPPNLTLSAAGSASGTLALNAPTQVPLGVGAATASGANIASLSGAVDVPVAGAAAVCAGSLAVTAASKIPLTAAGAAGSGSLALTAPTALLNLTLLPSGATGSLALTAPTQVLLAPAAATSDPNLWLGVDLEPRVSNTFKERWESGQHVGNARPEMRAGIRFGRFNRAYKFWPWTNDPPSTIGQTPIGKPWQATWTPETLDYIPIPSLLDCSLSKSTDSNGIGSATITIENIGYIEVDDPEAGPLKGHVRRRGLMAPLRGYVGPDRTPLVDEAGDELEQDPTWYDRFSRHAQITVWQSYGDAEVPVFTGLIDDVDVTSRPDQIIITARDFGQVTVDERVFGWNKDPDIKDPVVFIDRDEADDIIEVGSNPNASSEQTAHPAANIDDKDSSTAWFSDPVGTPNFTEWIEIDLPQGRYNDYVLWPAQGDMEIYVSLYVEAWEEADGSLHGPHRDGVDIPEGWVDIGAGTVPGSNGGIPYIEHVTGVSANRLVRTLGSTFVFGGQSKLRISFRDLGPWTGGNYAAGVVELQGRNRKISETAKKQKWILVDDVSDIVKVVLRWAGFKEWEVESAGVKLQKRLVIGRDKFYRDVIKICEDATGYVFFMADPTNAPESIGVPVFRKSRIVLDQDVLDGLTPPQPIIQVTDEMLLTEIKMHQTDDPLPYIIRVRGRESKNGQTLGSDPTRRIMFTYRPPWSGTPLAGIIKHVVHTNPLFKRMDDCRFGAYYIALQAAIAANQATIEFPGYPGVDLDDHIELMDLGTGLTTRLLVLQRDSSFRRGEQAKWTMTVSGVLVDVPDIQDVVAEIQAALR